MNDKVIGQGTHGIIKVINARQVVKQFENRNNLSSSDYEFIIQEKIYNVVCNGYGYGNGHCNSDYKILIPKPGKFGLVNDWCYYEMDYIYPPFGNNVLVQIDMGEPRVDDVQPGVGRFLGYENLSLAKCNIL